MKKKIIKVIRGSGYIIIITTIILVIIEFTLRLLGYVYSTPHIMHDKNCFWRMAPKQRMIFKDEYGKTAAITINSLGARGEEFSLKKPSGEKRIICVGDSYTYGWEVDDKHTYPAYLQNEINNDFLNIKVINFGCNGHTILHEVDFVKAYGLQFQPRYIIVETNLDTDFSDINEIKYNLGYMPMPGYNFIKYCIRKTAVGNILLKYWDSKKVKDIISQRKQLEQNNDMSKDEKGMNVAEERTAFDIYIEKLDELVKLSLENELAIIYVIIPYNTDGLDGSKIPGRYRGGGKDMTAREYYEFLKKRYADRITIIELMSYFNSQDLFLPDRHLNAKGNQLAAEIIYDKIRRCLVD